jgi:hypothetical protein
VWYYNLLKKHNITIPPSPPPRKLIFGTHP